MHDELRQAIDGFARLGLWSGRFIGGEISVEENVIEQIVQAAGEMSDERTGALIVIERNNHLDDIAANGVPVHADVTAALLGAIFYEGNPLHDGAVIVRDREVLAAACRLPVSESSSIGDKYHMRHRAGIGVSEQADCVVLIVSEERGSMQLAIDGGLIQIQNKEELATRLRQELISEKPKRSIRSRKKSVPGEEATL